MQITRSVICSFPGEQDRGGFRSMPESDRAGFYQPCAELGLTE
jgi:hypothetical protein